MAEKDISTWIGGCTMMGGYTEKALGAVIYPNGIIAIASPEIAHLLYENIPYYNNSTANFKFR